MRAPTVLRTFVAVVAFGAALTACTSAESEDPESSAPEETQRDEIVITCATCQESPTDPFLQYNYEAAQRFNEANAGVYRIETMQNPNAGSSDDRLQYYQRLALADDLPDVFQLNSAEIKALSETGKLHDFSTDLAADGEWAATFQEHTFDALSGSNGERWAIPQQRDPIGVYYNSDLLASVGFDEFPVTWDDFEVMMAKLRDAGLIAFALDGDWATMLMWTNLIGTQPGGVEFLTEEIAAGGDWGDNDAVEAATERLRSWHTEGYINSDAFSGDFANAAAVYNSGQAAMIANGPWYVSTNLNTDAAIEGLYEATGYAPAPGWDDGGGLIVVSGAGWVSAATGDDSLEAVAAFMKYVTSSEEVLLQAQATGANPAVKVETADLEAASLERLSSGLVAQSADVEITYPHVRVHGPAGFSNAWKNLWPAYVNGEMDTSTFLTRLSEEATAGAS
jgi:ABC-type glycerol-3-phosphate transport system substrate-binding protein